MVLGVFLSLDQEIAQFSSHLDLSWSSEIGSDKAAVSFSFLLSTYSAVGCFRVGVEKGGAWRGMDVGGKSNVPLALEL